MLVKNSLHELKTLERYINALYVTITRKPAGILKDKDDKLAQKVISEFLGDQLDKLEEKIAEKEKN